MKLFCQKFILIIAIASTINSSKRRSKGKHKLNNKSVTINNKESIVASSNELTNSKNQELPTQGLPENINIMESNKNIKTSNKINDDLSSFMKKHENENCIKQQQLFIRPNESNNNSINSPSLSQSQAEKNKEIKTNEKEMKTNEKENCIKQQQLFIRPNESNNNSINSPSLPQSQDEKNKEIKTNEREMKTNEKPIKTNEEEMKTRKGNESQYNLLNEEPTPQNRANISFKQHPKIAESNESKKNVTSFPQMNDKSEQQLHRVKSKRLQSLMINGIEILKMSYNEEKIKTKKSNDSSLNNPSNEVSSEKKINKVLNRVSKNTTVNNNTGKNKSKAVNPSRFSELSPEQYANNEVKGWKEKAEKYSKDIEKAIESFISSYEKKIVERDNILLNIKPGTASIDNATTSSTIQLDSENQESWSPYEKYISRNEIIAKDITYAVTALEDYMYIGFFKNTLEERDAMVEWRLNTISDDYSKFKKRITHESSKHKRIREKRDHIYKKRNGQYATANEICDVLRKLFFWQGEEEVKFVRAYVNNNPNWDPELVALCKLKWPKKGAIRFLNDPFTGMILDATKDGPDITLGILEGDFPHGFLLAAVLTEKEPYRLKIINHITYVKDTTMDLRLPSALGKAMETTLKCSDFKLYKPDGLSRTDAAHKVIEWIILEKPTRDMWNLETGVFSSYIRKNEKYLKKKEKIMKLFPKK